MKSGDRVRVTFEGVLRQLGVSSFAVEAETHGDPTFWHSLADSAVVEVLPNLPTVGDTITSTDQVDALPDGSIIARPTVEAIPFRKLYGNWPYHSSKIASWGDAVVLRVGGQQ